MYVKDLKVVTFEKQEDEIEGKGQVTVVFQFN